ncbi:MAG: hypothetical protein K2W82_04640 [Candidatus Obscuribacterales bacterium]|nr:hypothetical protein [Candidatus Obscuribacterales bacterium]
MPDHIDAVKLFEHSRLIVGMVLSLALARLLNGISKFVQHPKNTSIYLVHFGWVIVILLFLIHFWWWEFKLITVQHWTFEAYFLVILYAIVFFLMCAILFPDRMDEYTGFEDYFQSRHIWFFALFASTFVIDIFDTILKGMAHYNSLGIEYPIRNACFIGLSIAAMFINNKKFQLGYVALALIYEVSYILRLFHTQ